MKPGVELTKMMLANIKCHDRRWQKFQKEWFNTGRYKLHAKLNFHLRNRVMAIKKKYDKDKRDKKDLRGAANKSQDLENKDKTDDVSK